MNNEHFADVGSKHENIIDFGILRKKKFTKSILKTT